MHKVISGIKAIQFERLSTNQVEFMEPDYGYIKENHQSYAQRLALKAGCFEDVTDERSITLLQPAYSTKRAPYCTGFGMNDSGYAMKAARTTHSFPDSDETGTTFRTELRELQ